MRRVYIPNKRDSLADAKRMREAFRDEPAKRVDDLGITWPASMIEVGSCEAVMYTSDKWGSPTDVDYKHRAEGPQRLYVRPGFLVDHHTEKKLSTPGERVKLNQMPKHIALLAPILGIQCRLFEDDGELSDDVYQVDIKRAKLGAGQHVRGYKFLVVYDESDVLALVTGEILGVEKDGIVG